MVSANASTKYVPSAEETKSVPIFADGEVRISTATEWVLDSTTVYALQVSLKVRLTAYFSRRSLYISNNSATRKMTYGIAEWGN